LDVGVDDHKAGAPLQLGCGIVTVSDTRTAETDGSGREIRELLEAAGHRVSRYELVPDDASVVADLVSAWALRSDVDVVVLNGGTGLAPRDNTYEAVVGILTRRIDGFGELFRALSYREIGSAAMLSRAVGGLVGTVAVFALPGSTAACRLALDELVIPELVHIAKLADPEKWSRGSQ
jgi:molybdenum cofactor biosynthesis protein B